MKAKLTIHDWQRLLDAFKKTPKYKSQPPAAIRIENTAFTTARHYGGMTMNGATYIYEEPIIPGEKNEDGSQTVAWLMVRADFHVWAKRNAGKVGAA